MQITSSRFTPQPRKAIEHNSRPPGPTESVTFSQEYPPVAVGASFPVFGAIMNGINACDADPYGRTDLVHKSIGGAISNLAGTGLLVASYCKGSIPMGLVGLGLLGVSGFVAGHVFDNMP